MTKWIAAKRGGPMLRVLENLLALGTKRLNALKGSVQVFNMEVEVHGSPMRSNSRRSLVLGEGLDPAGFSGRQSSMLGPCRTATPGTGSDFLEKPNAPQ